jgi:uncharacterized protein YecE (DUF72 family)
MITFGTCSWAYESWIDLVYTAKASHSAGYLKEYSNKYRTVEVDSWFYKIPAEDDVDEYLSCVDGEFTFSCKLTESMTLTHLRGREEPNPSFLSPDLFSHYAASISSLIPQLFAVEMEFEYLNRQKMESLDTFLTHIDRFLSQIKTPLPLAIETRNPNYIKPEYFRFLKDHNISHVFSEKLYMPHIYEVYEKFAHMLNDTAVVRLLGGDRKTIEAATKGNWNTIVDEKNDLPRIVDMFKDIDARGKLLNVYVNNHYEGSAPLTIEKIQGMMK